MKRVLSIGVALILLGLSLAARRGSSADWYEFGFYKEWRDSQGNAIGVAYKACSGDPLVQPLVEGDISGTPAVSEKWMCDPVTLQTPDPCEQMLTIGYWDYSVVPAVWVITEIVFTVPCNP